MPPDANARHVQIMNKERSYEFGLEDTTGNLQGAFDPCEQCFLGLKRGRRLTCNV